MGGGSTEKRCWYGSRDLGSKDLHYDNCPRIPSLLFSCSSVADSAPSKALSLPPGRALPPSERHRQPTSTRCLPWRHCPSGSPVSHHQLLSAAVTVWLGPQAGLLCKTMFTFQPLHCLWRPQGDLVTRGPPRPGEGCGKEDVGTDRPSECKTCENPREQGGRELGHSSLCWEQGVGKAEKSQAWCSNPTSVQPLTCSWFFCFYFLSWH